MPRKLAKAALIAGGAVWPRSTGRPRVFVTILSSANLTGPSRFLRNLDRTLRDRGWALERLRLGACRTALVVSQAPGSWFYDLCRWRGVRTVLRADGFYVPELFDGARRAERSLREMTPERAAHNAGMAEALRRCDWVIYQSRFSKSQSDRHLEARGDRFSIIENGVDLEHFRPVPAVVGERRVVALGTWRDADLIEVTLGSFLRLAARDPDLGFDLVGTLSREIEAQVSRFAADHEDLGRRLAVHGTVSMERLPGILSRGTVALQLKSGDWCPNAVLELMACGVPVVCQAWGGTSELVEGGGIAVEQEPYCYDAGLSEKASAAAWRILEEPSGWPVKARERAGRFDMREVSGRYLAVLTGEAEQAS